MGKALATLMKGTAFVVLFSLLLVVQAHANGKGQIVIVNNAALKTAQSVTIQVYKLGGKTPTLVKTEMVVASEDCTNGCGNPSTAVDGVPGDYRIMVYGSVALETTSFTFPMHASDEFVWMVSNRESAPHIRARAPGVKAESDKSPFRLDLVTYTKGSSLNIKPAAPAAKKAKKTFWPFKPNTSSESFIDRN